MTPEATQKNDPNFFSRLNCRLRRIDRPKQTEATKLRRFELFKTGHDIEDDFVAIRSSKGLKMVIDPVHRYSLWSYTHSTESHIHQNSCSHSSKMCIRADNRKARLFDGQRLSKSPNFTILDSCLVSFAPMRLSALTLKISMNGTKMHFDECEFRGMCIRRSLSPLFDFTFTECRSE